ncbi:helix-turn-helix domain-containing protein [Streptomyces anandii]|uniref:helix-turn-helix domain-containing protein n=1 Tax=Streptomyces anandii TaxID=285454 RepID=UPI0036F4EBE5
MTQQQLADAACVALGTIRKIERGERGVTNATLEAIADALGVDSARLRTDRAAVQTRRFPRSPRRSPHTTSPKTARCGPFTSCAPPSQRPPGGVWRPSTRVSSASSPTC